jgi:hypothetical protein
VYCPSCGLQQPSSHRFCMSCGIRLGSEAVGERGPKLTRLFGSIPVGPDDDPDAILRVTRYIEEVEIRTDDGSVVVPNHHVRLSIWHGDRATGVISIPDSEAEELARFLSLIVVDDSPAATPTG